MKRILVVLAAVSLAASALVLSACGGGSGDGAEVMGISKYSRTELGTLVEFDVSNHQVDKKGQITQFDLHRTTREPVAVGAVLLEDVDAEDSTITLEYDDSGEITSARTEIPGYGFTMHELTYADGLIDTDTYSTDWSTVDSPYKHQFTYEQDEGTVTKSDAKRVEGTKAAYPSVYEYNENGDVVKITMNPGTDFFAVVEIEYDGDGNVTKITNSNADGVFLVREFEYVSLGQAGKAGAEKTGFQKWQEFSVVEKALMNCY